MLKNLLSMPGSEGPEYDKLGVAITLKCKPTIETSHRDHWVANKLTYMIGNAKGFQEEEADVVDVLPNTFSFRDLKLLSVDSRAIRRWT